MNIKKQFSDLRKNTPKHIQWLLLAAAFIVVLILLTLLLTNKDEQELSNADDVAINLNIAPDSVEWPDVPVGDTKTETIKISATDAVKIADIRIDNDIAGLTKQETCTTLVQIDEQNSCTIVLTYTPTAALDTTVLDMFVDWRAVNEPDTMQQQETIKIIIGANAPQVELAPTPAPQPAQASVQVDTPEQPAPAEMPETVSTPKQPVQPTSQPETSVKQEIKSAINEIAPANNFLFDDEPLAALDSATTTNNAPEYVRPSEACSDFAMPAYNLSGVQSGWIRPSGGAYYYYPFADTECKNPTGTYNPDNGIITDIDNPGQKIGTDAEHIGYTTIQNGTLPQLSNPATTKQANKATQLTSAELGIQTATAPAQDTKVAGINLKPAPQSDVIIGTSGTAVFHLTHMTENLFCASTNQFLQQSCQRCAPTHLYIKRVKCCLCVQLLTATYMPTMGAQ